MGCTVEELNKRMRSGELAEWMAYDALRAEERRRKRK